LEAPQHCPVVTVVAGHYMWTPIPSNQYLLPVAQLVPYIQMCSQCGTGLQELIQQNLQHKEAFCLHCPSVLWSTNFS
jgi:hypothetical protein